MATNPDPDLQLTTTTGSTRSLDDWTTMFHLCLVILPDRPEGRAWVPVAERIFRTLGDADCHTAFCVPSTTAITERVIGDLEKPVLTFIDPDQDFVKSLGLTHLPAFVHIRQNATVADAAEGWDVREWKRVAASIAKAMKWTTPEIVGPDLPPPTPGWPLR
ncbi:MAG: hypothetical protein JWL73_1228 [Actinomycetia bacterium]|nr:hypothetical protein [Actinomycetes bacterium]